MVCEIPFETLDDLPGKMPNLRQQMNDASDERYLKAIRIRSQLLSKKNAEERLPRLFTTRPAALRSVKATA